MKKVIIISAITLGVIIAIVCLRDIRTSNHKNIEETSSINGAVFSDDVETNTNKSNAAASRNIGKINDIFNSGGDIIEHLNTLNEFSDFEILGIWEYLLSEEEVIKTGVIGDLPDLTSADIFNEFLNRLTAMNSEANTENELERVNNIFQSLITAEEIEGVVRDYAIQRGIMWVTDSQVVQYREGVLKSVLEIVSDKHKDESYLGTAINMLTISDNYWNSEEEAMIVERLETFIYSHPSIHELSDVVSIPVIHAIDFWEIEGRENLYETSAENGSEYLKFIITNLEN